MSEKTRKIIFPIVIFVFALLVTTVLLNAYPETEQITPEVYKPLVRYQQVNKADVQMHVYSQGTVEPRTQSNVLAQVSGQIVFVSPRFAAGGYFKKNEVMLKIDQTDFKLAKTRAELQVAQAELRLAREKEEAKLARAEWQQIGTGEASDLVMRKPQLKEAQASLNAALATLEQAQVNLNRTEIKAPFDCRVRQKNADIGQVVNPGIALGQIYAIDYAEVRLPLPDSDLAYLDLLYNGNMGRDIHVKLQSVFAGKTHTWSAKLVRLEGEIDPRSRMVHVVAQVKDPYAVTAHKLPLSVGMFVNAEIEGRTYPEMIEINRSAMRGKSSVWVIDDQNKINARQVDILRIDSERVIIKDGLNDGERVCLSALDVALDGMEVRIDTAE